MDQLKNERNDKIRKQIEFYLSDANIRNDKFIKQLFKDEENRLNDKKFIELNQFMQFNRIKKITSEINDLKNALKESDCLELNGDETCVRRKYSIDKDKNVDRCTIYIENLPSQIDHDWLNDLFLNFGHIDHISIPRNKDSKQPLGFAFIEFTNERSASKACNFFNYLDSNKELKNARADKESLIDRLLDNLSVDELNRMDDDQIKNDKKRSNEQSNENAKRIRIDNNELDSDQDLARLLEQLKSKFQQNLDQSINLRVLSKMRWLEYKKEYLSLKRKLDNQNKAKNEDKNVIEFKHNSIIKLKYVKSSVTEEDSLFKIHLRKLANQQSIAYIDLQSDLNLCFIRFEDSQSALEYSQNDRLNQLGKVSILKDEEESTYLSKIQQSKLERKAKKNLKSKQKKDKKLDRQNNQANEDHQNKDQHDRDQQIDYEKGLIIKLEMDIEINNELTDQDLKQKIKSCINNSYVAYIDLDTSIYNLFLTSELIRKVCFIRCKSIECAKKVIENEKFKSLGNTSILDGLDEFDYWLRIKKSKRKYQNKKRSTN